jgi:RNA polymerase sigma-32 factor
VNLALALNPKSTLDNYMTTISKFPVLSPKREQDLIREYKETGSKEAAWEVICSNLRFVVKIAREYKRFYEGTMDLVQEGNIGLMLALTKYEFSHGTKFITYAVHWVRAKIQHFLAGTKSIVKMGTTKLQRKVFGSLQKLHSGMKEEELKELLDVRSDQITETKQLIRQSDVYIDAPRSYNEETYNDSVWLNKHLCTKPEVDEKLDESLIRNEVTKALSCLTDREKYVIEQHYMLGEKTFTDIGKDLGMSKQRIHQIALSALDKLRGELL